MPPPVIVSPDLERAIQRAIAQIPLERRGAVELDVTTRGAELEAAWRFQPAWTLAGYGAVSWHGVDREAGVRLKGSW